MFRKKLRNVNARMSLSLGNYHKLTIGIMCMSSHDLEEMCQNNLKPYAGELFLAVSIYRPCRSCAVTGVTVSVHRVLRCSALY